MRHETQNLLLLLVGGMLIKIVLDGSYLRYVRPGVAPILLLAGLIVVALALQAITRQMRTPPDESQHAEYQRAPERQVRAEVDHPPTGRDHAHGGQRTHRAPVAWLLFVPALTIMLIAPPALGSDAVNAGPARAVPTRAALGTAPLPPGEAPMLAVTDLVARAAANPTGPVTSREVTLVGFLVPARAPHVGTDLARLVISCCAADASPVRVHLSGPTVPAAPAAPTTGADQWMRVRGHVLRGTGTAAEGYVPTLIVSSADPTPAPNPVYEY